MSRMNVSLDEKGIDEIFRDIDYSDRPGAAVGIAIGGVPVYRKGFGLASLELPAVITPHTRMRIYSTTKHFTCLAYLLLCEEGRAGIDDRVGKYLPELHPVTHHVTMRHLMSNTSGLRDACELRWFFGGIEGTVPARGLLDLYREIQDVNFAPGEAWCYNNGGFHILSAVIERVAEETLEEVFRKRLFEPIGMHDTLLRRVDTDFVPNSATMHMTAVGGGYEKKCLPGELLGEAGIVSTVDDMLRWLRNMGRPVIGKPETWALMRAPQKLCDGVETGYGLGLYRYAYRGLDTISHAGGGFGSNSQMLRVPSADLDIVVLMNRSDILAMDFVGKILDACLGVKPSDVSGPRTNLVTGLFRSQTTGRVLQFYAKDKRQMALIDGGEEWQLIPGEKQALRPDSSWCSNLALTWRGDSARPESVALEYYGRTDQLFPVPVEPLPALRSIAGDYRADTIGVRMTIDADGEVGRATMATRFGSTTYQLEVLGVRLLRVKPADARGWGAILALDGDSPTITLRTSRMWQIPFSRDA